MSDLNDEQFVEYVTLSTASFSQMKLSSTKTRKFKILYDSEILTDTKSTTIKYVHTLPRLRKFEQSRTSRWNLRSRHKAREAFPTLGGDAVGDVGVSPKKWKNWRGSWNSLGSRLDRIDRHTDCLKHVINGGFAQCFRMNLCNFDERFLLKFLFKVFSSFFRFSWDILLPSLNCGALLFSGFHSTLHKKITCFALDSRPSDGKIWKFEGKGG